MYKCSLHTYVPLNLCLLVFPYLILPLNFFLLASHFLILVTTDSIEKDTTKGESTKHISYYIYIQYHLINMYIRTYGKICTYVWQNSKLID